MKKQGRIPDGGGWRVHGRQARPRNWKAKTAGVGFDYLHAAVDDHSRVAYIEAHPDERKDTAAGFLRRAVAWFAAHGVTVRAVMTDNGTAYRSHAVRDALTAAGCVTCAPPPTTPKSTARSNGSTFKHEWAYATVYDSNQARLDHLNRWQHHYNWHRAHTAHHGGTPMSAVNNVPAKHSEGVSDGWWRVRSRVQMRMEATSMVPSKTYRRLSVRIATAR